MDLGLSAINATAVVGHKGWLAGYQTCFDLTKSAVTKNNFGLGYTAQDFVLHTSVVNGTDFGGSVYQKVKLELFGSGCMNILGVACPGDWSLPWMELCLRSNYFWFDIIDVQGDGGRGCVTLQNIFTRNWSKICSP